MDRFLTVLGTRHVNTVTGRELPTDLEGHKRAIDLERYGKPVVRISRGDELHDGEYVVQHEDAEGFNLYAYAKIKPARTLNVAFHGAVRKTDTYPRFDRVASLGSSEPALLSIADPTLMLGDDLLLCWFLGSKTWDPLDAIVSLIRSAAAAAGATHIKVVGGSGGGFAAMRVGAALGDSLIFVYNPQTIVANYNKGVVDAYFEVAYPGEDSDEVIAREPALFDMREAFRQPHAGRRLYYLQHLGDVGHVGRHYRPFKRSLGVLDVDGFDSSGCHRFVLADFDREGHGPPPPPGFDAHLAAAIAWGGPGFREETLVEAETDPLSVT